MSNNLVNVVDFFLEKRGKEEVERSIFLDEITYAINEEVRLEGHEVIDAFKPTEEMGNILLKLIEYSITARDNTYSWEVRKKIEKEIESLKESSFGGEAEYFLKIQQFLVSLRSYSFRVTLESIFNLKIAEKYKERLLNLLDLIEGRLDKELSLISKSDLLRFKMELANN